MKTYLIVLALVALIAGGAGVVYWQSNKLTTVTPPTQVAQVADETADLKTYTNDEYKFSFEYPATFQYKEYPPYENYGGGLNLVVGEEIFSNQQKTTENGIHISVMKNYSVNNPLAVPNGMDPDPKLTKDLLIGGVEAKKYTSKVISYVTFNNGLRYEFSVSDNTKPIAEELETVITTFKFTK